MKIINEYEINNQMEKAWNEQDTSRFNNLLCLKKRYQGGDKGIQEFNEHQESKQNKKILFQILRTVLEGLKKSLNKNP